MIICYHLLQFTISLHMLTKECFSTDDIMKASDDYKSLTEEK